MTVLLQPSGTEISKKGVEVAHLDLGLGFIVPWTVGPNDPEAIENEIFSHYTPDENDLYHCLPSFPAEIQPA